MVCLYRTGRLVYQYPLGHLENLLDLLYSVRLFDNTVQSGLCTGMYGVTSATDDRLLYSQYGVQYL
jgi:hypothetical protein